MSLINEALKKAQHQRTGSALDAPPMPGGGSGGGRGNQGMPKGTLVLLIAGAAVVIVISVVATVYFINRTPAPKIATVPATSPSVATATAPAPTAAAAPSPVIIAPVIIKAPAPVVELPSAPPPVVEEPAPAPAATTAAPTPAPEPVVEGSLADRIANFVDKVRVTGIRTSENGSKVLMNDRVYRLNDVVDRKLGLKLVKIAADSLTFADANGATYVKNF
jgi:hypothetical protein